MKKNLSFLLLFVLTINAFAQKKNDILFTLNDKPVLVSEFKSVYNKNLELVIDESQKDVDTYLDLFIDYKLKVAEAYAQKLNEEIEYQKEFAKYEDQLSENYLFETAITEEMAYEAYQRGLEEVNVHHLLILIDYDDLPKDTLVAHNKILKLRKRAIAGEDFTELIKAESEEPRANESGGELGYFSVFNMVYPFETAAYNTEIGKISEIVRTQFGYHILKVKNRRVKEGNIFASHIMISNNIKERNFKPKERIFEIYAKLQQGESFESLAKQFSDDKFSANNGGDLKPFNRGDLKSKTFEDKAYQLKEKGEISEPIETKFGWHIIKLNLKYPIKSYSISRDEILKKIKNGKRSQIVTKAVNQKIIDKFGYTEAKDFKSYFLNYLDDDILKRKWEYQPIPKNLDKTLMTIGTQNLSYNDFASYIFNRQKRTKPYKVKSLLISVFFEEFKEKKIREYFKQNLEKENPEYATIINEYRNGLLIYDVMNVNIWEKAKNDSIGLQEYYQKTKQNYSWKQRVDAIIINTSDKKYAQQSLELLEKGKTEKEIKEALNTEGKVNVIISSGKYESGSRELPQGFEAIASTIKLYDLTDSFSVIKINKVMSESIKEFDSVKGKVISNYQNEVEKKWMEELRNKYQVVMNKKALKKVKKEFK